MTSVGKRAESSAVTPGWQDRAAVQSLGKMADNFSNVAT